MSIGSAVYSETGEAWGTCITLSDERSAHTQEQQLELMTERHVCC